MNNQPHIFDSRRCQLGEGTFWHPLRQQLFWFDITGNTLYCTHWQHTFNRNVSAAGWTDRNTLLIASETDLFTFCLNSAKTQHICPLEADNAMTRSNDGRADPYGGFWISTMGKQAQPKRGAIYRYYQGQLRKLFTDITIGNAICFSPDASRGYFSDTERAQIWSIQLDDNGWATSKPQLFVDMRTHGLHPDGAVCDSEGNIWNAQWGASRVAKYNSHGVFLDDIALPASQISCPSFGGRQLDTLYISSATQGLNAQQMQEQPQAGMTFSVELDNVRGQKEHQVIL